MILLVTPIARSTECAAALKETSGESVAIAENLLEATTLLRARSFRAVVLDHHQIEREPQETEMAFAHLGDAIPIEVNLSICGTERLVRNVKAALRRQQGEQAAARHAAARALHSELNNTLTALLLQFEAAFNVASLTPEAGEKLRSAQAAEKLRLQLETAEAGTACGGG